MNESTQLAPCPEAILSVQIRGVNHIGLRVCDEARAVRFYQQLGFRVVARAKELPLIALRNDAGVELHLIVNADPQHGGRNRLLDEPEKYAGYTHLAVSVNAIEDCARALSELGANITEGPVRHGPGLSLYVRDPDSNVLELRKED